MFVCKERLWIFQFKDGKASLLPIIEQQIAQSRTSEVSVELLVRGNR
jgi:hypothetical protein